MSTTVNKEGKLSESTSTENVSRELGSLCIVDIEQEAMLKRFEHERIETDQRARKAKSLAGIECVVNTGTVTAKPNSCLSGAEGMCGKTMIYVLPILMKTGVRINQMTLGTPRKWIT